MIRPEESAPVPEEPSRQPLPASRRVYVEGTQPGVAVPMREIALTPTRTMTGTLEENEPVRVYDTSGPWGDPGYRGTVAEGLPPLRLGWIRARGDVEEYLGRQATARDNGFLSETHMRTQATQHAGGLSALDQPQGSARPRLRASAGHPVTQMWYARQGIITPEMEFIAIRENTRISNLKSQISDLPS